MIRAAADLHGLLPEIEPCDLLLLAGDIVPYDIERDPDATRAWFAGEFAAWLAQAPVTEVIGIAGNHDFWAEQVPARVHPNLFGAPWTYLLDAETVSAAGLRIYGSPWTPDVYNAAMEAPAAELERRWQAIPTGLDVLMLHCPPRGHGDQLSQRGETIQMGSDQLTRAIERARPRLVIYGHAHQAYGYRAELNGGTQLANVSVRTDYPGQLAAVSTFAP